MDIFYEESATVHNSAKESKKYALLHVLSVVFLTIGILMVLFGFMFVPLGMEFVMWLFFCATFFLAWIGVLRWKSHYNVSYDYAFVSGELRISRVININKRKLVARFDAEDIVQIGDADSSAYERFRSDPTNKNVICTSNIEAAEGKFFMYILAEYNGKKLFVLECREELLMHIMRFAKRTALDHDYISQEKKKKL